MLILYSENIFQLLIHGIEINTVMPVKNTAAYYCDNKYSTVIITSRDSDYIHSKHTVVFPTATCLPIVVSQLL